MKKLFIFELYRNGKLVGFETHGVDPDLKPLIGIYHKSPESTLLFGNPVTGGDKWFIFHDAKKMIFDATK